MDTSRAKCLRFAAHTAAAKTPATTLNPDATRVFARSVLQAYMAHRSIPRAICQAIFRFIRGRLGAISCFSSTRARTAAKNRPELHCVVPLKVSLRIELIPPPLFQADRKAPDWAGVRGVVALFSRASVADGLIGAQKAGSCGEDG